MTLIATGAAGANSSNLLTALNERGEDRVTVLCAQTRAGKFRNLVVREVDDYPDQTEFVEPLAPCDFGKACAMFNEGARSSAMQSDGRYRMGNNFRCRQALFDARLAQGMPVMYASSSSRVASYCYFNVHGQRETYNAGRALAGEIAC
jgi:ADP-L-glycero-D-manno-heptose 6-epimerase